MTKAEIINQITEKYERELDLFNEFLGALKKQGIKYKPESIDYGQDYSEEYVMSVQCYDGTLVLVSKGKSYYHIAYWDDHQQFIKSENVY